MKTLACAALGLLTVPALVSADPIHVMADGAYWHHDSGWIFPRKIGEYTLVGIPQDLAGSSDASGWYEHVVDEVRIVASVELVAADSAADGETLISVRTRFELAARAPGTRFSESLLELGPSAALRATRLAFSPADNTENARALYFIDSGEWRIRIQISAPQGVDGLLPGADEFVSGQRWDTLAAAPR